MIVCISALQKPDFQACLHMKIWFKLCFSNSGPLTWGETDHRGHSWGKDEDWKVTAIENFRRKRWRFGARYWKKKKERKSKQEQGKDRQGEAEEKSLEWGKNEEMHGWAGWTDGQADGRMGQESDKKAVTSIASLGWVPTSPVICVYKLLPWEWAPDDSLHHWDFSEKPPRLPLLERNLPLPKTRDVFSFSVQYSLLESGQSTEDM